jgi:hypothetical protein
VEYLEGLCLREVTTRIRPAGVRKCAESNVRRVCAFIDGSDTTGLIKGWEVFNGDKPGWHRVHFDPRIDTAFSYGPGRERFNTAGGISLCPDGSSYVWSPSWVA